VADFRDLWTLAHHYPLSRARRALDRRTEARIMSEAGAVTVATDGFARVVREAYPEAAVSVVHNGYDPEMFDAPERDAPNTKLTLLHAGSLYGGRVDPAVLFRAMRTLVDDGRVPMDRIHLDLYSAKEAWLTRSVTEHGLDGVVTVHGTCPRSCVIEAYAASDILVLLQWDDPGECDVLPAKMLEYLASRRSILAVGSRPGGEVDRMLASTGAGTISRDVDDTADAIATLYHEFAQTGFVRIPIDEDARALWTQSAMAEAMHAAIESAVSAAGSPSA
jgi:glycosyltransferase involved in cell wall biosynthesis